MSRLGIPDNILSSRKIRGIDTGQFTRKIRIVKNGIKTVPKTPCLDD